MKNRCLTGEIAPSYDQIFEALPPLISPEYLDHLQNATPEELPPQVLVRACRQLVAAGQEEVARKTLERLFLKQKGRFVHLEGLLYAAQTRVPPNQDWQDAEDLLQDTQIKILKVLPTKRGVLAEQAWKAFCYQCMIDAWRERQGRRGERIEPERVRLQKRPDSDDEVDPLEQAVGVPPWQGMVGEDKSAWLENLVKNMLEQIPNPLVRAVADDQWLSGDPSPITGSGTSQIEGKPALDKQHNVSRDCINRARQTARMHIWIALVKTQDEHGIDLELYRSRFA